MQFLQQAVLTLIAQHPSVKRQYDAYLRDNKNDIKIATRKVYLDLIKKNRYYSSCYMHIVLAEFHPPTDATEPEKEIADLIKKYGWDIFIRSLLRYFDNKCQKALWRGLPTLRLDKIRDAIKSVPKYEE